VDLTLKNVVNNKLLGLYLDPLGATDDKKPHATGSAPREKSGKGSP
jgi:hypothetical protein